MYITVLEVTNENKIAKYALFNTIEQAQSHASTFGGNVYDFGDYNELYIGYVTVDPVAQTLIFTPQSEIDAANEQDIIASSQRDALNLIDRADQYVVTALVQGKALTPEFETYRSQLLDYTNLNGWPLTPEWPTLPENIFSDNPDAEPATVDLSNIKTNSVTFNSIDPSISSTAQSFTQTAYNPDQVLVLSNNLAVGRFMGGGPLVNYKADTVDGADWGQLGYEMNDDVNWSVSGWTGDVTAHSDYSYELDDHIEFDPNSSSTVEADVTGAEWVMHDTNSDRYWKFEFHSWTPWNEDITDPFVNGPPAFSYTRTEYSDPTTGTLDANSAVTFTVTGWSDSHNVDIILNTGDISTSIAIHRGFSTVFGNAYSSSDGAIYDQANDTSLSLPYGTMVAVVDDFSKVLDPNLKYYKNMDDAYGGGIGNKIVGSKMILKSVADDKYFGFAFTAWTQGGAGGGWAADVVELNPALKTGITFPDGTVQTTLGGDVSYNREMFDATSATNNNWAPMVFNYNPGLHVTSGTITTQSTPVGDEIAVLSNYGVRGVQDAFGTLRTTLSAQNLSNSTMETYDLLTWDKEWHRIWGSYGISWYNPATSPFDINRKKYVLIRNLSFGTYNDATIGESAAYGNWGHGSYTTRIILKNEHSTASMNVYWQNNHCDLNGFTMPVVAPGQRYCITVETVQTEVTADRWITAVKQIA